MNDFNQVPVDDWTDQDLLTKGEARERLVVEIDGNHADLDVALLERRLNAMRSIRGDYDLHLNGK